MCKKHTHALKLLFKLDHVFAVGNSEIVIWILRLNDLVIRGCSSDGQNVGGSGGPLCVSDFLHGGRHCFPAKCSIFGLLWRNVFEFDDGREGSPQMGLYTGNVGRLEGRAG